MNRVFSFIAGAVLGGLVGATMALLLAPASGQDVRMQMRDRAQRVRDEIQSAATARRAELEAELERLRAPRRIA